MMAFRVRPPAVAALLLVLLPPAALARPAPQDPDHAPPRESDLVERTGRRLVQVDVSVEGPPDVVADLGPEDFIVKMGFREIRSFTADGFCGAAPTPPPDDRVRETPLPPVVARLPASYVLYLDQPHLTGSGRPRALRLAEELIPRLVRDGDRAMLVSNARSLETFVPFTSNPDELLAGLERLARDRGHWDLYGAQELFRVQDVLRALNRDGDLDWAIARARIYQREEVRRTNVNLRRLGSFLHRLADVDPPKVLFYFGDTLRRNAGEHYLAFFGNRLIERKAALQAMRSDTASAPLAYDAVIDRAAADGVRLYTVLAQGLTIVDDGFHRPGSSTIAQTGQGGYRSGIRLRDAEYTLGGLATETGGRVFLHGAPASVIADRVRTDLSCLYLISFDPAGYTLDNPHRVVVKSRRAGVSARSRGRVVVQSEAKRLASRLLGAFTAPGSGSDDVRVHGGVVPLEYGEKGFRGLIQIAASGLPMPDTDWELGASLVVGDRVRSETSGRVALDRPGVPVVLESEMWFRPGAFEMVAVVREENTDLVASVVHEGAWPRPDRGEPAAGPLVLLQPQAGAFVRDGEVRSSGSLLREERAPVAPDRPLAFVGLVCRGRARRGTLRVERALLGSPPVEFDPVEFEPAEGSCVQIRDLVPARRLGPGSHVYELRIVRSGDVVERVERGFTVGARAASVGEAERRDR